MQQSSFLLDSPTARRNSHPSRTSESPSSPVLPLQNQRRSESTRNTRSISETSTLRYPEPPQGPLAPLPPPPTFKQFLDNRPSASSRTGPNHNVSRFSWTNSNAPQTPHDPSRDTVTQGVGRDSYMTQRSSAPRFRTVDSWVNQQANRIQEQKLREQFRMTQSTTASDDIPEVPTVPKDVNVEVTPPEPTEKPTETTTPLPPLPSPPSKSVKHARQDTRDTAPIFRAHPGTEVRFSTHSVVPSEILDIGRKPNVLS